MKSVTVEWRGKKYRITGRHCPGFAGSQFAPPEPESFAIFHIVAVDGNGCLDLLAYMAFEESGESEVISECLKVLHDDMEKAAAAADDNKLELMKENRA